MDITLEYYRHFYYVAELSSITKAANALCLSQPAVSRTIQNMETQLGCKLFVRTPKGMTLTTAGEALYAHVANAFRELELGNEKVSILTNAEDGELRIATTETVLYSFLLAELEEYQKSHPNVCIDVSGTSMDSVAQQVIFGVTDIAFGLGPLPDLPNCKTIPIQTIQEIVIAGTSYQEFCNKEFSLRELQRLPIVCLDKGTSARKHIDLWFSKHGADLSPRFTVQSTSLILPFVQRNLAIGIIPDVFVNDIKKGGNLFELKLAEPFPPRELYMIINNSFPISPICQTFINQITGARHSKLLY